MSVYRNPIFWMFLAFLSLIVITLIFSSVLTPYVCALVLAYLLAPLVDRLETLGISRPISGIIILIFAIGCIVGSILLVIPIFIQQAEMLISAFPRIYNRCLVLLERVLPTFIENNFSLETEVLNAGEVLKRQGLNFVSGFTFYAFALLDLILLIFVIPIITFYLLVDWNKILIKSARSLPDQVSKEINGVAVKIDNLLTGFVRGQLIICIVLSIFYSVALSFLGLSYGLLIGVFAGLISFIPFVGAALGAAIAVSVALYQFWDTSLIIVYVGLVFIAGQLLESNFFTPKLIGSAVRLHPIAIMLSISIGGTVAGITGILLAIPLAGIFAVLLRELGYQYLDNTFFKDSE